MLAHQFVRRLPAAIQPHLPDTGEVLHMEPHGRLLKIWYGSDKAIHYEVGVHERTMHLELGLHCEASTERNAQIRHGLSFYLFDIKAALGISVELEDWDRGWVRLYETQPLQPLDESRLVEFGERVGLFIRTVQPIYADLIG